MADFRMNLAVNVCGAGETGLALRIIEKEVCCLLPDWGDFGNRRPLHVLVELMSCRISIDFPIARLISE